MKYFKDEPPDFVFVLLLIILVNGLDALTTYWALSCDLQELNVVLYSPWGWVIKFLLPAVWYTILYYKVGKRLAFIAGFVFIIVFTIATINNSLWLAISQCR